MPASQTASMEPRDWDVLIDNIREGRCTPFIGAGACHPWLSTAGELAEQWANRDRYPFADKMDLARVAQYVAITRGEMTPKNDIAKSFQQKKGPNPANPRTPPAVLAGLGLPIYVTTNYDNYIECALQQRGAKPCTAFCPWNDYPRVKKEGHERIADGYVPSKEEPLVYHLHGVWDLPQSMLVTESDYVTFIRSMANHDLLPPEVLTALVDTELLFVGYSLSDSNFRILFQTIKGQIPRGLHYPSVAVQLPPKVKRKRNAMAYLGDYFGNTLNVPRVAVYWGDARQFTDELRSRM